MINGILAQKIGMTRIYLPDNSIVPVTVLRANPCRVIQVKNLKNDGYDAVQLGFGQRKRKNVSKPLINHLRKNTINFVPLKIREVKVLGENKYNPGDEINISIFQENEIVDVQGISKGKGFEGVVKRWNFGGGPVTHGQSDRLRAPGSIGSQRPQRVPKGRKMAGHLGNEKVTVKNLQIIRIDTQNNFLFVKGSVPGANNSVVFIKKTGKIKSIKQQEVVKDKKAAAKQQKQAKVDQKK